MARARHSSVRPLATCVHGSLGPHRVRLFPFIIFALAFACALVSGCAEVPADNPFDPRAPVEKQRAGRVIGSIQLPDGFETGLVGRARVVLRVGGAVVRDTGVGDGGAFVFEDVAPDVYAVHVAVPGFVAPVVTVGVGIGQAVDVGALPLSPATDAAVAGIALRSGAEADGHAGIFIEGIGTPYQSLTSSDGRFELALGAGTYDLRISDARYDPVSLPGVVVEPGRVTQLEAPIRLVGAPSSVRGMVRLPPGFTTVGVIDAADVMLAAMDGSRVDQTRPDVDGSFAINGVITGNYVLRVSLDRFHPDERRLVVGVGESRDLGPISLAAAVDAEAPARLAGSVERQGAPAEGHGGIFVEAVGTPFNAETSSDGAFELTVAAGRGALRFRAEGYMVFTVEGVEAVAGQRTALPDPVVLVAQPGRIVGHADFVPGFGSAEARAAIEVALFDGDGDEAAPRRQTRADATGSFAFDSVPPGAYGLGVQGAGFHPDRRRIVVGVGAVVDAGRIVLEPLPTDGMLTGIARIPGAPEHGHAGIAVEAASTPFRSETTSDGTWRLPVPASALGYDLRFARAGYATAVHATGEVVAGTTLELAAVLLNGEPGRIRGTVSLEAGVGRAGELGAAEVVLRQLVGDGDEGASIESGVVSEDGAFVFGDLAAGTYRVEIALDGFEPASRDVAVPVGAETDAGHLVLSGRAETGYVEGRVELRGVAEGGYAGTQVDVVGRPISAITTAEGLFAVDLPLREAGYTIRVTRRGYDEVRIEDVVPRPDERVQLAPVTLDGQPGRILGAVRLEPLDGLEFDVALRRLATISLFDAEGADAPVTVVRPDEEGRFVFDQRPAGQYSLVIELEGFGTQFDTAALDVGEVVNVGVVSLRSTVGGPSPTAIVGWVELAGALDHGGVRIETTAAPFTALSTSDGRFRLDVAPGRYNLRFLRAGYALATLPDARVGEGEVLELEVPVVLGGAPGGVRGTVVLPIGFDSPERYGSVEVALRPADAPDAPPTQTTRPNGDGRFVLDGVAAGTWEVSAELPGFRRVSRYAPVPVGTVIAVPLLSLAVDDRPAVVEGRVRRAGAPADGHGGIAVEVARTPRSTETTSDGRFRVETLPGEVALRYGASGFVSQTAGPFVVGRGEVLELEEVVTLPALPAGLRGAVRRIAPEGVEVPAAGADVALLRDDQWQAGAVVGADGGIAIDGAAAGTYDVRVTLDRHRPWEGVVRLVPGEVASLGVVVLVARQGSVAGRFAPAAGGSPTAISVIVRGALEDPVVAGVRRVVLASPDDGAYAIDDLPPGLYDVTAVAPGYRTPAFSRVAVDTAVVARVDGTLLPRYHRMTAPVRAGDRVELSFERDDDLVFARVWLDADAPPPLAPFVRLAGLGEDRMTIALPDDGPHVVRAVLANAFYVDGGAEPDAALFAAVSPRLEATVVRDTTSPAIEHFALASGGGWAASTTVAFDVDCVDAAGGAQTIRIDVDDGTVWTGSYRPRVTFEIAGGDGPRVATAVCADEVGLPSAPVAVSFSLDTTPPRVELLHVVADAPVADRAVTVRIRAVDDGAGVDATRVAEGTFDCATAAYGDPVGGEFGFALAGEDGPRRLYACARDRVGHTTSVAVRSNNEVVLDTRAPSTPTFAIGPDNGWSQAPLVDVTWATGEDDRESLDVEIEGALEGARRRWSWTDRPLVLALPVRDGGHTLRARLVDRAGNASPYATASVVVDREAPEIVALEVGDGAGFSNAPGGAVPVSIDCIDAVAPAEQLDLVVEVDGEVVYDDAYRSRITANIGRATGDHTLVATCRDPAGGAESSAPRSFVFDDTPPTKSTFRLANGREREAIRERALTVTLATEDDESGVAAATVAESRIDCATARYTHPAEGAFGFPLSEGDDERRLFVCLRDRAGNFTPSPIESDNVVVLDTEAPAAPSLELAGGEVWTTSESVRLVVGTVEDQPSGLDLLISGDLADDEPRVMAFAAIPQTIDLSAGDGVKRVEARWRDAAGNVSEAAVASVVLDGEPPMLTDLALGQDGYVTDAQGVAALRARCVDGLAPAEQLTLRVDEGQISRYDDVYRSEVPIALGGAQGPRSLEVACFDAAGHSSSATLRVTVDSVPPVVDVLRLAGGIVDDLEPVRRDRGISVHIETSDATSDVDAVAIGEAAIDCAAAQYAWPSEGTFGLTLSAGDGRRTLHACARDHAGNVTSSAFESPNGVWIDTEAPPPPQMVIESRRAAVNHAAVDVVLTDLEAGAEVELTGDIVERGRRWRAAAPPARITLTAGDGTKHVTAVVIDAAGNASRPARASLTLDTVPPADGAVVVAGGLETVRSRSVAISISGTAPDEMRFWNTTGPCGAPSCGGDEFEPFVPSLTHTLIEGLGGKRVCWRFCDAAGNSTPVHFDDVTLATYLDRPTPTLTTIEPESHVAYREAIYPLVVRGRGIAFDTRVRVGDFELPCRPDGFARDGAAIVPPAACVAGEDGTCATACTVHLPDLLVRTGGSHLVSLSTPSPVVGGAGSSAATRYFNVVAPLPVIEWIAPRGILQAVDATGAPRPGSIRVTLFGRQLMDSASFRLAGNAGRIVEVVRDPDDPGTRQVTFEVDTDGLRPFDRVDYSVSANNPAPGGGEQAVRFGVNPVVTRCANAGACVSDLRATRVSWWDGRGAVQAFSAPAGGGPRGVAAWGASRLALRDGNGRLMTAIDLRTAGGAAPFPFAVAETVEVADSQLRGDTIALRTARARSSGQYGARISLASPDAPETMVAGDLDADGDLDLVTAHPTLGAVATFLGDGVGGFTEPVLEPVGTSPVGLALADLDGDGVLDMVVANREDDGVVALFGAGDGGFGARFEMPMCPRPLSVEAADLDGDGAVDIVVASPGDGDEIGPAACLRYGDGRGGFGVPVRIALGGAPQHVAIGDVDGDGRLDLAAPFEHVVDVVDRVVVRLAGPNGDFSPPPTLIFTGRRPARVALADVNADGALDMAVARTPDDLVELWLGDGRGGFAAGGVAQTGDAPIDLRIADVTGDGRADLITADERLGTVSVVPGLGDGGLGAVSSWAVGVGARALLVADVDGDGVADLVSADRDADAISLRMGLPGASLGAIDGFDVDDQPEGLAMADLDGDGAADLIVSSRGGDRLVVRRADGAGGFGAIARYATGRQPYGVAVGDFDGDTRLDVVSADYRDDVVSVFYGDGNGGLSGRSIVGVGNGPRRVAAAQLNDDTLADIAVLDLLDAQVTVLTALGARGAFQTRGRYPAGAVPRDVALADVTGDGRPDLLTAEAGTGHLVYRVGLGDGGFGARVLVAMGDSPIALDAGDIDGDGIVDLVVAGRAPSPVVIRYGRGGGFFDAAVPLDYVANADDVAVADLDGDGAVEVVAAIADLDRVIVFRNEGGRTFAAPFELPTGRAPTYVAIADLDDDGGPDIVVAEPDADSVTRWRAPTPGAWQQTLAEPTSTVVEVAAGTTRTVTVGQARQFVESLAVVIRLEGEDLRRQTLTLVAPDRRSRRLELAAAAAAADSVFVAHYPGGRAAVDDLSGLEGWQPGGVWALRVTNGSGAPVRVVDFRIELMGWFSRPR